MRFDVVTLFPQMFAAVAESGITSRALQAGLWQLKTWNPRDFTTDNYRTVDDRPFGGGPGMVMLAEPLAKALEAARAAGAGRVIYLSPQGRKLDHRRVVELAKEAALTLLCGRYEGVDERLLRSKVDEELSLGDYVLSGGELAAMALIDACVRQLPGALGTALAGFCVSASVASCVSVLAPYAMPDSGNPFAMGGGSAGMKGLLAMAGMVASVALTAPALVLALLAPAPVALGGALGWGVAVLWVGTSLAGNRLDLHGPEILVAVTPRR